MQLFPAINREVKVGRIRFSSWVLWAVLLCLAGCSSPREEPAEVSLPERNVAVDESLLGSPVTLAEPPVEFRPPLDWAHIDDIRGGTLLARFRKGDGALRLLPQALFLDSLSGCVLVVSRWECDSSRWEAAADLQRTTLEQRLQGRKLEFERYLLNGQKCQESVTRDSTLTNVKLLLESGAQLDFMLPGPSAPAQMPRVEAAVGTVKPRPAG